MATVICNQSLTNEEILYLLRRDVEFRHSDKTLSDVQIFAEALKAGRWNPPIDLDQQARRDCAAFLSGEQPPDYIREAIVGIFAAGK